MPRRKKSNEGSSFLITRGRLVLRKRLSWGSGRILSTPNIQRHDTILTAITQKNQDCRAGKGDCKVGVADANIARSTAFATRGCVYLDRGLSQSVSSYSNSDTRDEISCWTRRDSRRACSACSRPTPKQKRKTRLHVSSLVSWCSDKLTSLQHPV